MRPASPRGPHWSPEWRIDQPASILWYHPHPLGTEKHVQRGLAGMFLADDKRWSGLDLPKKCGVAFVVVEKGGKAGQPPVGHHHGAS